MKYQGGCHCGAIQFEIEAPPHLELEDCNCSICTKSGYLHLLLPRSKFQLLQGAEHLTTYTFGTGVAQHTFCQICGIKPFYTPRSNPDGISINFNCLETQPQSTSINKFDGQNWEQNAYKLAHKSREEGLD